MDDKLIVKIATIEIPVSDLDKSQEFYTEILGLHTVEKKDHVCYLSFGEKGTATIKLTETDQVSPLYFSNSNENIEHNPVIDFYTTDIHACHHFFHDVSLSVTNIEEADRGKAFYFQDPDEHWLSMSSTNHANE
ncbi:MULTISPECIES: VOC family protein [Pontibacillus]|uniref:VOC family protein n=1 Tax=Pontibacillus chungwhensis TaxID=265426 RepID=A0ABY8UY75_9BACI|nr:MULTISPECIES: VOC family protein [Pontibacillus]MCD5325485.1 VOC family protein [Pontibacillus sp. HN14]WIF98597.1 VOC family protein [Pontibacillus chungwhensis]